MGSIDDIAEVAEKSAGVNHAQLVGDYDGTIIVTMYNWNKCFEGHTVQTALKGTSHTHYFRFTADNPDVIFVKNASDDLKEREIKLLKLTTWIPTPTTLPEKIIPPGLSLEQWWYLYHT